MRKNGFIVVGILNIGLVFGLLMGCASAPPPALDPQLVGIWVYGDADVVGELRFQSDSTGTFVTYPINGDKGTNVALLVRDGGKTLVFSSNGKKMSSCRIEEGKLIMTDYNNLAFSRAQTFEAAGSTWAFTVPEASITYSFADDGTYKMESTGGGAQIDLVRELFKEEGVDGTGAYSVSDYKVTLKPTGGVYCSLDGGGTMQMKKVETYTAMFINGAFYLEGLFYKRAQ